MSSPVPSRLARLPIFYGWIIVAAAFVTMAVGVNARTAFSLLFPPILTEFALGPRRGRRRVLVRLLRLGVPQPVRRTVDGPQGPALRGRDRRHPAGDRTRARAVLARAVAALPDARHAGRRRRKFARLRGAIAIHPELVRAAARACDRHRVLRRRDRIDRAAALAAARDQPRRLALGLLAARADHHRGGGAAQSAAAPAPAGDRPQSRRRRGARHAGGRQARAQHRQPGLGVDRMDACARAAHRAVLVDRARLCARDFTPGMRCRSIRPST